MIRVDSENFSYAKKFFGMGFVKIMPRSFCKNDSYVQIMELCDDFRDQKLVDLGVKLEDKASYILDGYEIA